MAPVWWGKNASADTKFEGARTKRACLAAVASTRTSLVPRPSAAYTARFVLALGEAAKTAAVA